MGVGVAALVLAVFGLHSPTLLELVAVPATFVFANLIEWLAHRYLMHQRHWPLTVLYDRHTPQG